MVFQHFNLFYLTILDNIILAPMKIKGISREEATKRAKTLLEKVDLVDKIDAYPVQLSEDKNEIAMPGTGNGA